MNEQSEEGTAVDYDSQVEGPGGNSTLVAAIGAGSSAA